MGRTYRLLLTAAATGMLAGCTGMGGTIQLGSATTEIGTSAIRTPCTPQPAPAAQPDPTASPQAVAAAVKDRFDTVTKVIKGRLAQANGGANAVIEAAAKLLKANLDAGVPGAPARPVAPAITLDDIREFARAVQDRAVSAPTPAEQRALDKVKVDVRQFNTILVTYLKAYVEGKYVDQFGNTLAAPVFSRTVGDTEIAGAVSVIGDAIADDLLLTPIWVDNATKPTRYYPAFFNAGTATAAKNAGGAKPAAAGGGAQSPEPTAATVKIDGTPVFKPIALVNQGTDDKPTDHGPMCGIDAMKSEAIEYLAQTAAMKASTLGGFVSADFGGVGLSFGGYYKLSIGDNQTIQTLAKTLLAKLAERVALEGSYRVLFNVNDNADGLGDVADLVLWILQKQQTATATAAS